MVTASDPIPMSQIYANIKIAVGGGINEPRDALGTIIYGLLTNPEQFEEVKRQQCWGQVFEEGVRWVAPIQASSRLVLEDTEIRGFLVPKGDTVMTIKPLPIVMKMSLTTESASMSSARIMRTSPSARGRITVPVRKSRVKPSGRSCCLRCLNVFRT